MKNAFERAYDAYVQRKQVDRQLRWLQLRAELAASAPVLLSAKREAKAPYRPLNAC
ncbi:MAG: hypothetical protein NVS3B25_04210 [Hymenobacter sp.]